MGASEQGIGCILKNAVMNMFSLLYEEEAYADDILRSRFFVLKLAKCYSVCRIHCPRTLVVCQ